MVNNFIKCGGVIWITGLSGSGKTTLAKEVIKKLREQNINGIILDGDQLRDVLKDINPNKSYGRSQRLSLAFKYSSLCKLFADQGHIVVIATISLFKEIHNWNRNNISNYFEVYLQVPINELRRRDSKNIYKKFELGLLSNIAGLDIEIDEPRNPDLNIKFNPNVSISEQAINVLNKINEKK